MPTALNLEARRIVQSRGLAPTADLINREVVKLSRERKLQAAQQEIAKTKQQAFKPVRKTIGAPVSLPQTGGTGALPESPITTQSQSFTPATLTSPSITETSPITQRTGGVSTQIAPAPQRTLGFTPDAFESQLRTALQNELSTQTGQLRGALQTSTGQFLSTPETLAGLPGFENLTIDQLRGLRDVERRGLGALISGVGGLAEQRQTQFEKSLEGAVRGFEKSQERAETLRKEERQERLAKEETLADSKQQAIKAYLNFKDDIIRAGGVPDSKAGQELIARIQKAKTTEDVAKEFSDYQSMAAPFVQKLFAPKRTGGGEGLGDLSALLGTIQQPQLTQEQQRLLALGGQAEQALATTQAAGQGLQRAATSLPGKLIGAIPGVGQALQLGTAQLGAGLEESVKRERTKIQPSEIQTAEPSQNNFLSSLISTGLLKPKPKDLLNLYKQNPQAAQQFIDQIAAAQSPADRSLFNQIVNGYSKSPLIQSADKMKGYLSTIESAGQGKSTPQKDLNLIYSYIKALDYGESAVREGEIQLGRDLGSVKQQLGAVAARLGGTGLLEGSQRQQYIQAAKELINSINSAAKQKEQLFKAQAETLGVGKEWETFRKQFQPAYDLSTDFGTADDILKKHGI